MDYRTLSPSPSNGGTQARRDSWKRVGAKISLAVGSVELSIFPLTRQIFKPFFNLQGIIVVRHLLFAQRINSAWASGDGWRFNDKMSFWFNFFLVALRFVDHAGCYIHRNVINFFAWLSRRSKNVLIKKWFAYFIRYELFFLLLSECWSCC